jgi:Protein of unknown function (DUF3467)
MSEPPSPPPSVGRVQLHLPAGLDPVYANFAVITHSPSEIVVDLAQILPQVPQARVRARVILTPLNAKLLHRALGEHLGRFEAQFGEIRVPDGPTLADHLFRPSDPPSEPPAE